MKAFHNDPSIKDKYLARINAHMLADEIVKGRYWENGKGCAVGCTIHSDNHAAYEIELGIPRIIARIEDRIFENLPNELAMTWPKRFLEAIPIGKDLSKVWPKFAIFLLTDSTQCASRHPQCKIVADSFAAELNGEKINWDSIRAADAGAAYAAAAAYAADAADAAAYAAAAYAGAAYAAAAADADAGAAYAADAAAYAADAADAAAAYAADAADAADAAAAYAAAAAARFNAFIDQSEKLLELLGEL